MIHFLLFTEYAAANVTNTSIVALHDKKLDIPFQEGRPHLICQYDRGHPFIINVICSKGKILYVDIHGVGDNANLNLRNYIRSLG